MLLRLEAAVIVAERLGGPPLDLAMKVVVDNRSMPTQPMKVVGDAMAALRTLNDLAQNHPGFTLEDSAPSP